MCSRSLFVALFSCTLFVLLFFSFAYDTYITQDAASCPLSGLLDMEQRQASAGRLNTAVLQSQQQKGSWLPDVLRQLVYSQVSTKPKSPLGSSSYLISPLFYPRSCLLPVWVWS